MEVYICICIEDYVRVNCYYVSDIYYYVNSIGTNHNMMTISLNKFKYNSVTDKFIFTKMLHVDIMPPDIFYKHFKNLRKYRADKIEEIL